MQRNNIQGVIVIEGCDGTGKSTLAHELCKRYHGHYVHLTYIRDHTDSFFEQARVLDEAAKFDGLTVIDRHWPSENVYAACMRKDHTLGAPARMMDRVMLRLGGLYILARHNSPDENQAANKENAKAREEMYEDITSVAHRYDQLWSGLDAGWHDVTPDYVGSLIRLGGVKKRPNWMGYNFNKNSLDETIREALLRLEFLRANQIITGLTSDKKNWLGHAGMCETIFVLDDHRERDKWPMVNLGANAMFLAQACQRIDLDESKCAWVNTADVAAYESLSACLLAKRKIPTVVALGDVPASYCTEWGAAFVAAPHVGFARRTMSITEYAFQLKEALK